MGLTTVRKVRENGLWLETIPEIGLRDLIDIYRRKYLEHLPN
jgi:hypothetical protein